MAKRYLWCSRYFCECSKESVEKRRTPCTKDMIYHYCLYRKEKYYDEDGNEMGD